MNRAGHSLAVAGLAALAALAGCSSSPSVRIGSTNVRFDDVIAHADDQASRLRSLHGEGTLQIESPEFSQSVTFNVILLRPDSLELTFTGPFGITVAQALITRVTFQLYTSIQNRLYVGDTSPENLEKAVRIGLRFDDIIALFTGGRILTADRRASYTSASDGADAVFVFSDGPVHRRYVIDPATHAIRKLQILNGDGSPVGEQSFSSFDSEDGITYPRMITITQHAERRRISLYYDSIELNTATPASFTFSVPSNAERVELE